MGEETAKKGDHAVKVPDSAGRTDVSAEQAEPEIGYRLLCRLGLICLLVGLFSPPCPLCLFRLLFFEPDVEDREVNGPVDVEKVVSKLEEVQAAFNASHGSKPCCVG